MGKYRALPGARPSPGHILCWSEPKVFLLDLLNLGQDLQPLHITCMLCRLHVFTGATEWLERSRGSKARSLQDVRSVEQLQVGMGSVPCSCRGKSPCWCRLPLDLVDSWCRGEVHGVAASYAAGMASWGRRGPCHPSSLFCAVQKIMGAFKCDGARVS